MEFSKGLINGRLLEGPIFLFDKIGDYVLKLSGPSISMIVIPLLLASFNLYPC